MRGEVYAALVERVGSTLDYDIRCQPNEYEPDGFVEPVRPLELTNDVLVPTDCPDCGAQLLSNRAEVTCACGQIMSLIWAARQGGRIQMYPAAPLCFALAVCPTVGGADITFDRSCTCQNICLNMQTFWTDILAFCGRSRLLVS